MNNFVTIFNNVYNKFIEMYEQISNNSDITNSEANYLSIIYSKGILNLTKFAELAKITKPAATQIVNKYVEKGYVKKTISKNDKRVCYLEVTDNIKKYFEDSYKKINKFYNDCLAFLSEDEFEQLNNLLLKINNNL